MGTNQTTYPINTSDTDHIVGSATANTAGYLTGGTNAQSAFASWAAVTDGSFRVTVDGTAYNVDAIDFSGDGSMADVATTLQSALQTATSSTETVAWSTDHFVITSATSDEDSEVSVLSTIANPTGTDISGAGANDWMDADTGNGTATAGTSDHNKLVKLNTDGKLTDNLIDGNFSKFGGDGSDGALSISSGTTNIDCSSASIVVKNYTSISITGTADITFTNPHTDGTIVIFRSQGDITMSSTATPCINVSEMGGSGKTNQTNNNSNDVNGSTGGGGKSFWTETTGGGGGSNGGGTGGTGGTTAQTFSPNLSNMLYPNPPSYTWIGAGGGTGHLYSSSSGGASVGNTSGKGSGSLIIECAGAFNFPASASIYAKGEDGGNGYNEGPNRRTGGGGGGSGGLVMVLYNTLTDNSGTISVTGGTGGNSGSGGGSNSRAGGAGGGNPENAGSGGTSINNSGGTKTGGDGAAGTTKIVENKWW